MKRSEAESKLRGILDGKRIDSNWEKQILDAVEAIGMLPPSCVKLKSGLTVSSVDVKNKVINYEQDQVLTTVNEWEEE